MESDFRKKSEWIKIIVKNSFVKGTSMYYVIKILCFLTPPPPPFVITFSTARNQKSPFSDPPPPPFGDGPAWMIPNRNHKICILTDFLTELPNNVKFIYSEKATIFVNSSPYF